MRMTRRELVTHAAVAAAAMSATAQPSTGTSAPAAAVNPVPVRVGMTDWNLGQRGDIGKIALARDGRRRHPGQPAIPGRRDDPDVARPRDAGGVPQRGARQRHSSARSRSARPASRGCRCTPTRPRRSCWSKRWRWRATSVPRTSCCQSSATAASTCRARRRSAPSWR